MEYVNKRTGNKIAIVVILFLMILTVITWVMAYKFIYAPDISSIWLQPDLWISKTKDYATHLTTIPGAVWMSMNVLIISFLFEILFLIVNIAVVVKRR